jgi:hypothetical protein
MLFAFTELTVRLFPEIAPEAIRLPVIAPVTILFVLIAVVPILLPVTAASFIKPVRTLCVMIVYLLLCFTT